VPHRLVEIAQKLKELDLSQEPHLGQHQIRSSVNRAYYAAYLTARDYCHSNGLDGIGASHERIARALIAERQLSKTGKQLLQVKDLRRQADYDWGHSMTYRDIGKALRTSHEIIAALKDS
jgi:uncharacterized protein (UPF0332 family)